MTAFSINLRPVVREILSWKIVVRFSTARVFAAVIERPECAAATLRDVEDALQWNADSGFVHRTVDREASTPQHPRHAWQITPEGLAKANEEL